MRHGIDESPLNPLPAAIWLLVLPIIASEVAFGLASAGLFGGASMRALAIERSAFAPEILLRMIAYAEIVPRQMLRLVTYPFIHYSLTHAAFVTVFALALGKQLSEVIAPHRVVVLFFGSAIGAALVYSGLQAVLPLRLSPLVGGYPAVYGFVGGFTFLIWARLGARHANRMRAFSLIAFLLGFQLVFGLVFGGAGTAWMAEVAGFAIGFALTPLLIPGGLARARQSLRQR